MVGGSPGTPAPPWLSSGPVPSVAAGSCCLCWAGAPGQGGPRGRGPLEGQGLDPLGGGGHPPELPGLP